MPLSRHTKKMGMRWIEPLCDLCAFVVQKGRVAFFLLMMVIFTSQLFVKMLGKGRGGDLLENAGS